MDTTVSTTIKVLNEPNKVSSIMKNLARLIIRAIVNGLENVGAAEAYWLGIDPKESREEKVN